MNTSCHSIQEKIACEISMDTEDQNHLNKCRDCKSVLADYKMLLAFLDEERKMAEVPEGFAEDVMLLIEQEDLKLDWYERFLISIGKLIDVPLIQYGAFAAGFGVGVMTFIRFVAFIFIPA